MAVNLLDELFSLLAFRNSTYLDTICTILSIICIGIGRCQLRCYKTAAYIPDAYVGDVSLFLILKIFSQKWTFVVKISHIIYTRKSDKKKRETDYAPVYWKTYRSCPLIWPFWLFGREELMLWQRALTQSPRGVRSGIECSSNCKRGEGPGGLS